MREFLVILLVVGFVGAYFWQLVAIAAAVGLCWLAMTGYQAWRAEAEDEACRNREIARRADQQHAWVLEGDERGTYGVATKYHQACTAKGKK